MVHRPEKLAVFVRNHCCTAAAARAHQGPAPQIWTVQYMYLPGLIRSTEHQGTNIEGIEIHACVHYFLNFVHLFNGLQDYCLHPHLWLTASGLSAT